jgi:recombination associated protein RdgC
MLFKNILLFSFTKPFTASASELETALSQRAFAPCGSLDAMSLGWVSPTGVPGASLVHAANGFLMVCLQRQEKLLPASVVTEIVGERVDEIEAKQDRKVRGKEKTAIRDEVIQDLLPQAFVYSKRAYAYIDPVGGYLVVDAASGKKADELTGLLRQCLGSLAITPVAAKDRPATIMTAWLLDDSAPDGITIESECELKSTEEDGSTIKCKKQDLGTDEVRNHIEAGKEVVKLALTWKDRITFVLDDNLAIKRLRFLDIIQEQIAETETDDPVELFDRDFAIMALELREMVDGVVGLFGGVQEARA